MCFWGHLEVLPCPLVFCLNRCLLCWLQSLRQVSPVAALAVTLLLHSRNPLLRKPDRPQEPLDQEPLPTLRPVISPALRVAASSRRCCALVSTSTLALSSAFWETWRSFIEM